MKYIKQLGPIQKRLLLLLILAILIGGGIAIYKYANKPPVNKDGGTTAAVKSGKVSPDNQNTEAPQSDTALDNTTVKITDFSQSNGVVRASATINSNQSGTCYFNFSSENTKPVSRTVTSQSQDSAQLCTVEISEVEFTKLGSWNMYVSFTQDNAKAEASQDVVIN